MPKKNFLLVIPLLILYSLFLFRPFMLTTTDIGRHITNGDEIVSGNFQVLYSNFYSYTLPELPFINHHWFSGVLFYLTQNSIGFSGLHIIHSIILMIMFAVFYKTLNIVNDNKTPWMVFLLGILAVLIFSTRVEIRPESIGYLFISVILYRIFTWEKELKKLADQNIDINNKDHNKIITWTEISGLLVMQLIWVNSHISFIFGIFLVGLFLGSNIFLNLIHKNIQKTKYAKKDITQSIFNKNTPLLINKLIFLLTGQIFISILNPNHIKGLLAPFSIFTNYGYSVVENQTMWFLRNYISNLTLFLYFSTALMTVILLVFFWKKASLFTVIISIVGVVLGFTALRNIPIFVLFSFPFLAISAKEIKNIFTEKISLETPRFFLPFFVGLTYFVIIFMLLSGNYSRSVSLKKLGIGLVKNQLLAAEFFQENNLEGPIFNNYDLGSYLIYSLPDTKVFVDNRPEAYSVDFFKQPTF